MPPKPVNVLKLIKKSRRPPAKVKHYAPKEKPLSKRPLITQLATLPRSDLLKALDELASKINPTDIELIRVVNIMRTGMPYSVLTEFFRYHIKTYPSARFSDLSTNFWKFYSDYDVDKRITKMRAFITARTAKPVGFPPVARPVERKPSKSIKPIDAASYVRTPRRTSARREKTFFGHETLLSECEKEYRRAPWMYEFIKKPVRGMVLKRTDLLDEYATNSFVIDSAGERWYIANVKWYERACDKTRPFVPGSIAYITSDGKSIVVENHDMYTASKESVDMIIIEEFGVPTEHSFEAAKNLLAMNDYLIEGKVDLSTIVKSLPNATNHSMARALSKILVFLGQLIKHPQIHIERTRNGQYKADQFVNFDRYIALPEVYKNPSAKYVAENLEAILKRKRRTIENRFYDMINEMANREPGRKIRPSKIVVAPLKYQIVELPICPINVNDLVYYEEDGVMYCFGREDLLSRFTNPVTSKPLTDRFRRELEYIGPPRNEPAASKPSIEVAHRRVVPIENIELAPGLFEKLRQLINVTRPLYCTRCNIEMFRPQYQTVDNRRKLAFCSQECINAYTFK